MVLHSTQMCFMEHVLTLSHELLKHVYSKVEFNKINHFTACQGHS